MSIDIQNDRTTQSDWQQNDSASGVNFTSGGDVELAWKDLSDDEGFESGSFGSSWTANDGDFHIATDRTVEGTYSAKIADSSALQRVAWNYPFDRGQKLEKFDVWYNESGSSTGGGMMLKGEDGGNVLGWATDNTAWYVDESGGLNHIGSSGGYDTWTFVEIWIDWSAGTYDIKFSDVNGREANHSGTLKVNEPIVGYDILNFHSPSGGWTGGTAMYMWFDNIYCMNHGYADAGIRYGDKVDLTPIGTVDSTQITFSGTTNGETIGIYTRISTDGGSTWGSWSTCISGGSIPGISSGDNVSGWMVQAAQYMESADPAVTPQVHSTYYEVNSSVTHHTLTYMDISLGDKVLGILNQTVAQCTMDVSTLLGKLSGTLTNASSLTMDIVFDNSIDVSLVNTLNIPLVLSLTSQEVDLFSDAVLTVSREILDDARTILVLNSQAYSLTPVIQNRFLGVWGLTDPASVPAWVAPTQATDIWTQESTSEDTWSKDPSVSDSWSKQASAVNTWSKE